MNAKQFASYVYGSSKPKAKQHHRCNAPNPQRKQQRSSYVANHYPCTNKF